MFSFRFVILAVVLLQRATAMVIPEGALQHLERRGVNCPQGGKSPCVCTDQTGKPQLGIKVSTNNCPDGKFVFSNPNDLNSGTMVKVPGGRTPDVQCDHVVEAQFVADRFIDGSPMCAHFLSPQGKADFAAFKKILNTPVGGNFVFLNTEVNLAKGKFIGGQTVNGRKQVALGVASYLTQTRNTANTAAQALKAEMDRIATKTGFASFPSDFVSKYDQLIVDTIAKATARAKNLPTTVSPPTKKKTTTPKKTKATTPTAPKTPVARQKAQQKIKDAKKKAVVKQKVTGN